MVPRKMISAGRTLLVDGWLSTRVINHCLGRPIGVPNDSIGLLIGGLIPCIMTTTGHTLLAFLLAVSHYIPLCPVI